MTSHLQMYGAICCKFKCATFRHTKRTQIYHMHARTHCHTPACKGQCSVHKRAHTHPMATAATYYRSQHPEKVALIGNSVHQTAKQLSRLTRQLSVCNFKSLSTERFSSKLQVICCLLHTYFVYGNKHIHAHTYIFGKNVTKTWTESH